MVVSSNRAPPIPLPNTATDGTILEVIVSVTESDDRVVHVQCQVLPAEDKPIIY